MAAAEGVHAVHGLVEIGRRVTDGHDNTVVLAVLQEFLVLQCFRCQGDDLDDVGIWFEPGKIGSLDIFFRLGAFVGRADERPFHMSAQYRAWRIRLRAFSMRPCSIVIVVGTKDVTPVAGRACCMVFRAWLSSSIVSAPAQPWMCSLMNPGTTKPPLASMNSEHMPARNCLRGTMRQISFSYIMT